EGDADGVVPGRRASGVHRQPGGRGGDVRSGNFHRAENVLGSPVLITGDQGRVGVVSSPADEVGRIGAVQRVEVIPDLFGDPGLVGAVGRFALRFVGDLPVPVKVSGAARGVRDRLGRHLPRGGLPVRFGFLELLGVAFWVL